MPTIDRIVIGERYIRASFRLTAVGILHGPSLLPRCSPALNPLHPTRAPPAYPRSHRDQRQLAVVATMLARIRSVSAAALEQGSLNPIETEHTLLPETSRSPPFLVRLLRNFTKPRPPPQSDKPSAPKSKSNPFLPYDPTLHVQHLPPSHVLLLNKFPVVPNHALIVTAAFEPQSSLLTLADHAAVWHCLSQFDSLVFYNAGPIAGASQPHKHLQLLPTPLQIHGDDTPFASTIDAALRDTEGAPGVPRTIPQFGFLHALISMYDVAGGAMHSDMNSIAQMSMHRYTTLMSFLEKQIVINSQYALCNPEGPRHQSSASRPLHEGEAVHGGRASFDDTQGSHQNIERQAESDLCRPFAYNLLLTRRWMMVVPRRKETWRDISVNSLGFVGCLLVRNEDSLREVEQCGGLSVLRGVTFELDDLPYPGKEEVHPSVGHVP